MPARYDLSPWTSGSGVEIGGKLAGRAEAENGARAKMDHRRTVHGAEEGRKNDPDVQTPSGSEGESQGRR